eukprot:7386517-Prymnesium_polylepis.1
MPLPPVVWSYRCFVCVDAHSMPRLPAACAPCGAARCCGAGGRTRAPAAWACGAPAVRVFTARKSR